MQNGSVVVFDLLDSQPTSNRRFGQLQCWKRILRKHCKELRLFCAIAVKCRGPLNRT
jgi:hypothetical protein